MTTDVDFMLCSDLRANYAALGEQYRAMVEQGQAVMVVPAFEYGREAAELDVEAYPSTKPKLLEQVKQNDLLMFHNKWKRGHGPTQYEKWYEATEPYQVVDYNYNYEPYILMKREGHPW